MLFTGKSVELMGLATFNVILAMVLSATFMGQSSKNIINKLTDANVSAFINETTAVSSGQRADMDQLGIAEYLMKHIDDASSFTTTVEYDMPGVEAKETRLELDKKNYIGHILEGLRGMTDHEATTRIEGIEIDKTSKQARVITTSYERAVVPVESSEGEPTMVPVRGVSYCEQTLVLKDEAIRMAGATCSTNVQGIDTQ